MRNNHFEQCVMYLDEIQGIKVNHNRMPSDGLAVDAETDGEATYALPNTVGQQPEARNTANLEELFDGECYASTYQTNGQCHIYQELPEVASKPSPKIMTRGIAASHDVIHSRPALPLRMTASSASVSKFPYTMPGTPALSVFDTETPCTSKPPGFQGFPYVESRPSTATMDRKSSMRGYPRQSLASSSYLESKPSSITPDETPVSLCA